MKKRSRKDFQWHLRKPLIDITNSVRNSLWEKIKVHLMLGLFGSGLISVSLTMQIRQRLPSWLHTCQHLLITGNHKSEGSITANSSIHLESSNGSTSILYLTETEEHHIPRNIHKRLCSCSEIQNKSNINENSK